MQTDIVKAETDVVLRLLRSLPPRERLRMVVQVRPELEDELPAADETAGFWQGSDMGVLAEHQGVEPLGDLDLLLGGWPEDESVDDFGYASPMQTGESRRGPACMRTVIVVPYDGDLCKVWARFCVDRQRLGHPISVQDAWIAATAVRHGCPSVTHNCADFAIHRLVLISQS